MFNLGFIEVVVILSIALVVIGPKQLPELARLVAKLLNEFRRATEDVTKGFSSPSSPLKTHDIEKSTVSLINALEQTNIEGSKEPAHSKKEQSPCNKQI